jgi:hypothetical protein
VFDFFYVNVLIYSLLSFLYALAFLWSVEGLLLENGTHSTVVFLLQSGKVQIG